ncbi:MAG: ABC transporter ATP-binding protein [Gammaproteobacteria bacterium RIFCSPLOWO2_02_FULL_56_15]|nr:MAG: ABC transporter ATP-binding protein [Gammaproteobacteria bacterium RIFCSPLOWO2_02_FULL_56_15]
MPTVLEVRNLRKCYRNLVAVDDISFCIPEGICFGLLGPNGAGKTTTIEMIEGITQPTSGEILYRGKPRDASFSLQAGIQFQATSVMEHLKTREILRLFHSLYQKTMPLAELVKLCDLESLLEQTATRLSGGQKQRLMFALSLVNDPEFIFLDEPTTGLDPQSRRNLWKLIERVKAQGKNVLMTTHYMDEAEILCDHLIIIDHGRIIAEGSPAALLREYFGYYYVCLDAPDFDRLDYDPAEPVSRKNGRIEIQSRSVNDTLQQLLQRGALLNSLSVRQPTLEDLFLKLTGHTLRE